MKRNPVTWDQIKGLLKERDGGMSNREIAEALDADRQDVANLTNLMRRAGEIAGSQVWGYQEYQRSTLVNTLIKNKA